MHFTSVTMTHIWENSLVIHAISRTTAIINPNILWNEMKWPLLFTAQHYPQYETNSVSDPSPVLQPLMTALCSFH